MNCSREILSLFLLNINTHMSLTTPLRAKIVAASVEKHGYVATRQGATDHVNPRAIAHCSTLTFKETG